MGTPIGSNEKITTIGPQRSRLRHPTARRVLAARHWAYSQDLLARNIVIFAGRTVDKTADSFAICVIRASSEEAARAIMDGDPAVEGGLFRARLFPYQPMLMGEWPDARA